MRERNYSVVVTAFVSVLFSEPKIPQSLVLRTGSDFDKRFSALQRAENSSMLVKKFENVVFLRFQCSSASRKFLNKRLTSVSSSACGGFSALQRAENSSIRQPQRCSYVETGFQCSSASRKFLNASDSRAGSLGTPVSVLFSEPKIPQSTRRSSIPGAALSFSALQRAENSSINVYGAGVGGGRGFSALQRAENSSIPDQETR